jgi:hypothetical protein
LLLSMRTRSSNLLLFQSFPIKDHIINPMLKPS